jgi:hypothetical protein
MNPHDPKRIVYPSARQYWRAFVYVMHLHENHCIKRAGVAGLRARADRLQRRFIRFILKNRELINKRNCEMFLKKLFKD